MRLLSLLSSTVFLCVFIVLLSSCTTTPNPETADILLTPAKYSNLPGWRRDNHGAALGAMQQSCKRILRKPQSTLFGSHPKMGTYGDWNAACSKLMTGNIGNARVFLETYFTPYQVSAVGGNEKGLFTGYYEPLLHGSRSRLGPYQHAIHVRPKDLIDVDLGEFRDDLKGRRIAGRVVGTRLKPYYDHRAITEGALVQGYDEPLVWVNDPVDAFFLHIQGSGRIKLVDGETIRVGYAGQNGHPYYAIGRTLVQNGEIPKDKISLQTIRKWLKENPDQAWDLMHENPSYVFFKELETDAGPKGGEGVILSPQRSLAVDHTKLAYGLPLWVSIDPPAKGEPKLQRLMIAQDTGGAIRGAVRGDVFWGHGRRAEYLAGHMKSQGKYWVLLPR